MGVIELRDVTVDFDSTKALDRINIRAEPGEMLSLIGPNGAGKTTALRVMAGLLEPTKGEIFYNNERLSGADLIKLRKRSTLVFQKPAVFSTSVFKNVAYGLRVRDVSESEIEKRVKDALKQVELYTLKERFARNLSGGEQRRLCLAMGIVTEPEILYLDEPTAYLDSESTQIVEAVLKELNKEKRTTIVISTHNIMQAENLTRRAILIQNGTVQRTGLTSEILRDQLETLVFDDTTRNIFSGSAEFTNGLHSGMRLASIKLNDDVSIDAITDRDGKVTVRIPPEDIVVSLGSVLSSARNTLKGRVSDISLDDAMALLTVDVGVNLVAQITRSSLENLRVALDDEVDVTFKASSVRVY